MTINLKNLPTQPGIYIYKDEYGEVIYVGKSVNIKSRVSSYFNTSPKSHKIDSLVKVISGVETIITTDEVQALLLEQDYIKKFRPKFNTLLRDDKSYPYIFISEHKYPQIKLAYQPKLVATPNHYGPYVSGFEINFLLETIEKLVGLRTCSDAYFKSRTRACLKYSIDRCVAPCVNEIKDYLDRVSTAKELLNHKTYKIKTDLKKKMVASSEEQDYEQARVYRDMLFNLERTIQAPEAKKAFNTDVWGYYAKDSKAVVSFFAIRNGRLNDRNLFFTDNTENFYENIINQYYFSKNYCVPFNLQEIFVEKLDNNKTFLDAFYQLYNQKIKLVEIGDKLNHFFNSAMKTAKEELLARQNKYLLKEERGLVDLADKLGLPAIKSLGCFDISNSSGKWTVGAYTHYSVEEATKENKSHYRLYHIETDKNNDVASMYESVYRHFKNKVDESTGEIKSNPLPSLLIIDGGLNQINASLEALSQTDIELLPIIGIAKGITRKAINERYFFTIFDKNTTIDKQSIEDITDIIRNIDLTAIRKVRDEAHRFSKKNLAKNRDELRIDKVKTK